MILAVVLFAIAIGWVILATLSSSAHTITFDVVAPTNSVNTLESTQSQTAFWQKVVDFFLQLFQQIF